MRKLGFESSELRAVETLMLEKFRSEPFHNLKLLYGRPRQSGLKGGTCSDKTLSFLSAAEQAGFDVALHTGFIGFRTEIADSRIKVFHERVGKESLQLEINVRGRPEDEIKAEIARRFSSGIAYPFNNSLRFSLVIGERFLFLRGDQLEIYSDQGMQVVQGIEEPDASEVILRHFGFDVGPLIAGSSTIP